MKSKEFPIIVTTLEALENCVTDGWRVIYIDFTLYLKDRYKLEKILQKNKFVFINRVGRRGVFYVKTEGENAYDPMIHEIYDPMGIL